MLVDFLQKAAMNAEIASSFTTGEQTPFNTVIEEDDKVRQYLTAPNDYSAPSTKSFSNKE